MHPHKRDSLLGTGSIGRSHGGLARTSSHESLTAHPLLSPTLPGTSSPSSSLSSTADTASTASPPAPRYVPYTPRQRGTPTAATTGATVQPSIQATPPAPAAHGDATSQLQLMHLKAAAQKGGLDAASTGWAILERLGTETDHGAGWNDVWNAIAVGKATLLLPLEAQPVNEPITPEFIKDHVAFWDGSSVDAPVVTLSGMRGTMANEILTLQSTIDTTSKSFQAILDPATRNAALGALPPLPLPIIPVSVSLPSSPLPSPLPLPVSPKPPAPTGPKYPSYNLTSHHPSLPLPPRPHAVSTPTKPPLPPRPRPGSSTTTAARIPNPFASLFGRTATPPASPTANPSPLHAATTPGSPDGAIHAHEAPEPALAVPAFTLSRRINRRAVARDVLRVVHAEVRAGLAGAGAPGWVAERLDAFAAREGLLPFARAHTGKNGDDAQPLAPRAEAGEEPAVDDVARRFQDFYAEVEDQLVRRRWRGRRAFGAGAGRVLQHLHAGSVSSSAESAGSGDEREDVDETEKESEAEDPAPPPPDEKERKIRAVVEAVERTICSVFYDRLFMQSSSDDATHDEALSSRIAAVNLLDLTLAHLGVDVGDSAEAVEAVVKACGETLSQLDASCRAPADKAAMLVAAHKILVDGLSRLPPIKLKPEEELLDDKTPRAHTFGHRAEEEEDGDDDEPADDTAGNILQDSPTVVLSPDTEDAPSLPSGKPAKRSVTSDLKPPSSPRLTISPPPPATPTPVSGDLILPLMIFAAVKANPPHLVSHLLFTQRFRNQSVGGEESYCLINLMAVAEFLENVDLAALGLGESEKTVISTAELTPISVTRPGSSPTSPLSGNATLRGRVEQQVDAITGSANKVISGVVDSSFGVLRALLPGTQAAESAAAATDTDAPDTRPGFGLLRRDTGFSIASLAASLPGAGMRAKTPVQKDEEAGQQLVEVPSRPASVRSVRPPGSSDEDSDGEDDEEDEEEEEEGEYDTRSIRSFESMMSSRSKERRRKKVASANAIGRKSLSDRLANMPGLSRLSGSGHEHTKTSPPASRRSSLLVPPTNQVLNRYDTPSSSRAASPVAIRISPPNQRFLDCTEDDIKVSEVGELLKEYKRMVEAVRAMGGFHQDS